MKKNKINLVIIIIFIGFQFSNAQLKRFSLDFSYPYSLETNFLNEKYEGLVDVGLKYRVIKTPVVNLGIAFNGSLFKANELQNVNANFFDSKSYFVQPKLFIEFNIKQITKFRPYLSVGYAYNVSEQFLQENDNNENTTFTIKKEGVIINTGISYDFSDWFYIHAQYDFIQLKSLNQPIIETQYSNIIKAGLGFRI